MFLHMLKPENASVYINVQPKSIYFGIHQEEWKNDYYLCRDTITESIKYKLKYLNAIVAQIDTCGYIHTI